MKKILWLVNSELPQIAAVRGRRGSNTCGWITGAYDYINTRFELTVVYPVFKKEDAESRLDGDVRYVAYLHSEDAKAERSKFAEIIKTVSPDLIDVWGTEFERSHNFILAAKDAGYAEKTVISMQGSSAEIAMHYTSNLKGRILRSRTLRDLLRRDSIVTQRKKYEIRAESERDSLKTVRHCIGKTEWDEAVAKGANPDVEYHRCCEILRPPFYAAAGKWNAQGCKPHSLLLCQGNYPLKGLHIILDAVRILKSKYPDVLLTVTGTPPFPAGGLKARLRTGSYGKYIRKLIDRYGVAANVRFAGMKDDNGMVGEYLNANAVVLASSVENESNSVSEAHVVGTPVIASFSGGVTSRVTHGVDGLMFSYDDPHMLAFYADRIFSDPALAQELSANGVKTSERFNDPETNNKKRESVYLSVING